MHRWATAPFCGMRNLEHNILKRGNSLLTQISGKK
jgi:hypothetical protein